MRTETNAAAVLVSDMIRPSTCPIVRCPDRNRSVMGIRRQHHAPADGSGPHSLFRQHESIHAYGPQSSRTGAFPGPGGRGSRRPDGLSAPAKTPLSACSKRGYWRLPPRLRMPHNPNQRHKNNFLFIFPGTGRPAIRPAAPRPYHPAQAAVMPPQVAEGGLLRGHTAGPDGSRFAIARCRRAESALTTSGCALATLTVSLGSVTWS